MKKIFFFVAVNTLSSGDMQNPVQIRTLQFTTLGEQEIVYLPFLNLGFLIFKVEINNNFYMRLF